MDAYLLFSIPPIAVPFVARYRTLYTALGIVAAEFLLALAVTNRYRDRLPYRFWRRAHYLNLAVWAAATVHGLGSGTDRGTPWLLGLFCASVAVVLGAGTWRALRRSRVPVRGVSAGLAAAGVLATVLVATGPLRFSPKPWNARSFDAAITGQVVQNVGSTRGLVSAAATAAGSQRALIRADLLLEPNRVDATSFQLELLPSGLLCTGSVTQVQSFGFDARCRAADGTSRSVHASWRLTEGNRLQGRLAVRGIA